LTKKQNRKIPEYPKEKNYAGEMLYDARDGIPLRELSVAKVQGELKRSAILR
jgi:hypothetical protein